jgi:hypothetical protein
MCDFGGNQITLSSGARGCVQLSDGSGTLTSFNTFKFTNGVLSAPMFSGDLGNVRGTTGQLSYFDSNTSVTSSDKLVYDNNALRLEGDLFVSGNTYTSNNINTGSSILKLGYDTPPNSTKGLLFDRPGGHVMMGYLSNENNSAYMNTLVFGYTFKDSDSLRLKPDTGNAISVQVLGNVTANHLFGKSVIATNVVVSHTSSNVVECSDVGVSNALTVGNGTRVAEDCVSTKGNVSAQFITATALGININGTAMNASNVNLVQTSSPSTFYLPLTYTTNGYNVLYSNPALSFVPSTGTLSSTSFVTTSDRRIKTNITNIVSTVDDLKPVKYFNGLSNSEQYGFIADEVQKVLPELVQGDVDGSQYQTINYIQLIPILVKEIQELKKRINV